MVSHGHFVLGGNVPFDKVRKKQSLKKLLEDVSREVLTVPEKEKTAAADPYDIRVWSLACGPHPLP